MIPIENVRDLEIFQCVASERSFSAAARALGMTQPAVSLAIARLERQLGTTLFDRQRSGRGSGFLTSTGSILYTHATLIINELSAAVDIIVNEEGRRPVRIGLPPILAHHFFPDGLYPLVEAYGSHPVEIVSYGSEHIFEQLEHHGVDVGMIASTSDSLNLPRVRSSKVASFPFIVAVSSDKADLYGDCISLAQLEDMRAPLISFTGDFVQHETLTALLEQGDHKLNVAAETNQPQMLTSLVASGLGVGIATSIAFGRKPEGVHLMPLAGDNSPLFNVFVFEDIARAVRPEAEVVTAIKRCLFDMVRLSAS